MTLTQITEKGIKDGEIINADINASAAIAKSKIETFVNSNSNNRIITGSNTTNTLEGEANLTYNGQLLQATNSHINISSGYAYQWGDSHERIEQSDGKIEFFTDNTEKVTLSGSTLGIGTTSPDSNFKLDVNGAARIGNTTDGIIIENSTSNPSVSNACRIHRNGATGELNITSGTTTARNMIFNTKTSGAESMRLTSTGDFCVGTTTATGKAEIATSASEVGLTVTNDTHDSYLQILATAANKNSAIFFGDNGDGNIGAIDYDHNTNELAFKVNGTEKARIDNTGDIGIGSSTINLQGTDRTTVSVNGTNSAALCLNRSDTITGFLYADSGEFRIQAEAGASNLVKIRNNNGTICQFDDDGIKFNNDTAAVNGLDDYEEGTWTPDVNSRTSGSPALRAGNYVKIGTTVHLTCHFDTGSNSLTSSVSVFTITGLPFTAKGGNPYGSTGGIHFNNAYSTAGNKGELHGLVPPNTSIINVYYSDSSTMVHLPVSQFGTGNFLFSCTYIAAS